MCNVQQDFPFQTRLLAYNITNETEMYGMTSEIFYACKRKITPRQYKICVPLASLQPHGLFSSGRDFPTHNFSCPADGVDPLLNTRTGFLPVPKTQISQVVILVRSTQYPDTKWSLHTVYRPGRDTRQHCVSSMLPLSSTSASSCCPLSVQSTSL